MASDQRAALWRAQQRAAARTTTINDLRRYCLDSLTARKGLGEDDPLRGYRQGLQAVLREIHRIEAGGSAPAQLDA